MNWKYEYERIYSENDKGELMAEVTFKREKDEEVNIDHVYVNPVLRGKGVASKAMLVMVEYLRKEKLKATATCSYANDWFKKNEKEYLDVISDNNIDAVVACKIGGKH